VIWSLVAPYVYGKENLLNYWLKGGFPDSLLASTDKLSLKWRKDFIYTFLNRDILQLKLNISSQTLEKLWLLCAHNHGTLLNYSNLSKQIGINRRTVVRYFEILESTYMIRKLQPYSKNLKSRIIKTPKIYIRDTGILHSLLNISDGHELLANEKTGESWEGMVIENLIEEFDDFEHCFYRTTNNAEIDFIMYNKSITIAVECKSSSKPSVTRGFWSALETINPDHIYIAAPVEAPYPFHGNEKIKVGSLKYVIDDIKKVLNQSSNNKKTDSTIIELLKKQ